MLSWPTCPWARQQVLVSTGGSVALDSSCCQLLMGELASLLHIVESEPWVQVQVLKIPKICPKMLPWLVQPLNVGLLPLLLKTLIFHHCSGCLAQDKWCVHQSDLHVVLTSFSIHQLNVSYFVLNTCCGRADSGSLPSQCLSLLLALTPPSPSPIVSSLASCLFMSSPILFPSLLSEM